MVTEVKTKYADNRRKGLYTSKTARVIWKSKSRHVA